MNAIWCNHFDLEHFFLGGEGGEVLYVITILRGEMFLLKNKKFNYIRIMLEGGEYSLWLIQ